MAFSPESARILSPQESSMQSQVNVTGIDSLSKERAAIGGPLFKPISLRPRLLAAWRTVCHRWCFHPRRRWRRRGRSFSRYWRGSSRWWLRASWRWRVDTRRLGTRLAGGHRTSRSCCRLIARSRNALDRNAALRSSHRSRPVAVAIEKHSRLTAPALWRLDRHVAHLRKLGALRNWKNTLRNRSPRRRLGDMRAPVAELYRVARRRRPCASERSGRSAEYHERQAAHVVTDRGLLASSPKLGNRALNV